MKQKVRVGLVGFGTVGCGVAKLLIEEKERIERKTGIRLELACVVDKDTKTKRSVKLPAGMLTNDINRVLADKTIDIGVELVGGTTFAKDLQFKMLAAGKDVVTANKALLAEHGNELFAAAVENQRCIAFEASCAGGIPIISAIRTGLSANDIQAMYGIVNGTCNYILSNMTSKGEAFSDALSQAQAKGYAEADPTLDINGSDSAHKLAILSAIAFGHRVNFDDIYVEGIDSVSVDDIRYGQQMGYTLKLLAIGQRRDSGKISLRVHPSFISSDNPLAKVDGPFNAVSIFGSAVGNVMFHGRGAGMMPTASAVVADIIDVALGNSKRTFDNLTANYIRTKPVFEKSGDSVSRFYIRLMVRDQAGVFAKIANVLAKHKISISGILQREYKGANNIVPAVIITHENKQKQVQTALADLDKLNIIHDKPVCIRIVDIPEDKD
ncbi:MAG: homoserine dehydrogenase [Phycisphaerae bacterium]|nr:homoserine dehydrogenase [Phycisphaerae bacterium]